MADRDTRTEIESRIVAPIFASVANGHRDQSLPEVVLENRRNRALARVVDALASRGVPRIPSAMQKQLESMIQSWSGRAFDDGFQPIREFEIQCARDRDLVLAEESGDPKKVLDVYEKDYRRRVVERFGSIELRGVQLSHRVILDLDQVYVPLHFTGLLGSKKDSQGRIILTKPEREPIAGILKINTRILLVGAPGSGKSTLVSYIAAGCASGSHSLPLPAQVLPLVLTVRELKDAPFTVEWLATHVGTHPALVEAALKQQRAALLIDGLDEAPQPLRDELTARLVQFTKANPRLHVLVTSRPAGAPGEIESCMAGFRGYRVTDLTDQEVQAFIDKWCLAAEQSARSTAKEANEQANAAASDLKARIVRSKPVQRIAVNPLLTTILCVVHRYLGRTIPEHRVTLYEKCTDALLYEWDRAKFQDKDAAIGKLAANQKRALLRGVASALHEKHEAEMDEAEVVRHFAAKLPEIGQPQEDALRIVREIRDRSGILVERRPGVFGFSHLTFQEYFTALDYASRTNELLGHIDEEWWHEVIALTTGMSGSDSVRIIEAFLEKEDRVSIIMAAECMETAISVPLKLREKVEAMLDRSLRARWFHSEELKAISLSAAPILTRALPTLDRYRKAQAAFFFQEFAYEPAIPAMADLTSEDAPSGVSTDLNGKQYEFTVGEMAIWTLGQMAQVSTSGRVAFVSALSNNEVTLEFLRWLQSLSLVGDNFKLPRAKKRASKRAKKTA